MADSSIMFFGEGQSPVNFATFTNPLLIEAGEIMEIDATYTSSGLRTKSSSIALAVTLMLDE